MFQKKTWTDREVEHPGGRMIEFTDGNREPATIYRNEGNIIKEGDALNAPAFNDLENRIGAAFEELNIDAGFTTHIADSGIHVSAEEKDKIQTIDNKVNREDGKGLSSNDFTDEDKAKLDSLPSDFAVTQSDWDEDDSASDAYIKNKPAALPASDVYNWAKQPDKPDYTAFEVGADIIGSAAASLSDAKEYTDDKIADLMTSAIGNKADKTEFDRHTGNEYIHTSKAEKEKLKGIAEGANAYTHPSTSGNKHIPSGGSSGQILRWASDGTAVWGADNNTDYTVATQNTNGLMSAADKKKLDGVVLKADLLKAVYPVGSIYISVNAVNPGTLFGGTWVAWGSGRVPVGVNTADNNFNAIEKTGGISSISLTTANLPSHSHGLNGHTHSIPALSGSAASNGNHNHQIRVRQMPKGTSSTTNAYLGFTADNDSTTTSLSAGAHAHSVTTAANTTGGNSGNTASTGNGTAHTNLQPYITCYMWKRTA